MVFYDWRSTAGPECAEHIAAKLQDACPELTGGAKVIECRPDNWTKNAYNTIAGVSATAICFEPFFMDFAGHRPLLSDAGLARVGIALAEGINDWLE